MNIFFEKLFVYNHQVNQQIAQILLKSEINESEKLMLLFSHILNAHHIWNSRILNEPPRYDTWEMHPPQDLREIDNHNYEVSLRLLRELKLDTKLDFKNVKRPVANDQLQDLLFHIINHSGHHRAQIASQMKDIGLEALATDFIFYKLAD